MLVFTRAAESAAIPSSFHDISGSNQTGGIQYHPELLMAFLSSIMNQQTIITGVFWYSRK
jgi:hypothetical protein